MKLLKLFFIIFLLFTSTANIFSLDIVNIWRHSEIADKNSLFCDFCIPPLVFDDFQFNILPVEIRLEYFPPVPLPFSLGLFVITPNPNLKHFGARLAYHFDFLNSLTDFYLVYSHNFGWLRNDLLLEYNDTPVDLLFYDIRIGVRHFFNDFVGIALESGYHFESIIVMLSIKLN